VIAFLKATGSEIKNEDDIAKAIRQIFDEWLQVHDWFSAFANAVMVKTAKQLRVRITQMSVPVSDLSKAKPVLFVDVASIKPQLFP